MAAKLNLVAANVTYDEGVADANVSVVVRNNTITVRRRQTGEQLQQREGVTAIEAVSNNGRMVRFEDGTSWLVERIARGCGCGGG